MVVVWCGVVWCVGGVVWYGGGVVVVWCGVVWWWCGVVVVWCGVVVVWWWCGGVELQQRKKCDLCLTSFHRLMWLRKISSMDEES